jgi:hypothetical protein
MPELRITPRLCIFSLITSICLALLLGACSHAPKQATPRPRPDADIEDVLRIPQKFEPLVSAAGGRLAIEGACRNQLLDEFYRNYFRPWNSPAPFVDPREAKDLMRQEGRARWSGVNKRRVPKRLMQSLLENCALETFPSRNEPAIAVAPAHLRGLPTVLPLYKPSEGAPFDMMSYPQVKLNEPLRVLHRSRDGAWLFVESAYSTGWLETRDVALVDRALIETWTHSSHLVVVKDYAAIADGRGIGNYPAKVGTILPLLSRGEGWAEAWVASAGDGGRAVVRATRIPVTAVAPFPMTFDQASIALVGNELLGQQYGWGEIYGLRDCSALLRDFFLPFGIWLPRTALDQVTSVRHRVELGSLGPAEKEEMIKQKGVPFLTLLYKPGHIMLYAGMDQQGRPLVFQDAWSIRVKEGKGEKTKIIGSSVITTLKPGAELGLVAGQSLLERITQMAILTQRCKDVPPRERMKVTRR